jgi:hypothetical protein
VQFELHFFQPVSDVDIIYALDKHGPGVCVVLRCSLRFGVLDSVKCPCGGAVNKGAEDLNALGALLITLRSHVLQNVNLLTATSRVAVRRTGIGNRALSKAKFPGRR